MLNQNPWSIKKRVWQQTSHKVFVSYSFDGLVFFPQHSIDESVNHNSLGVTDWFIYATRSFKTNLTVCVYEEIEIAEEWELNPAIFLCFHSKRMLPRRSAVHKSVHASRRFVLADLRDCGFAAFRGMRAFNPYKARHSLCRSYIVLLSFATCAAQTTSCIRAVITEQETNGNDHATERKKTHLFTTK